MTTIPRSKKPILNHHRGLATVEMALVMPMVVLLFVGVMEFGSVFYIRNIMLHAASDAARLLAVPGITIADAEQLAQDRLSSLSGSFTVSASEQPSAIPGNIDVTVEITVPKADISLGLLGTGDMAVSVTLRKET